MIPKIIHFCWFGRGPMPELAERCISSWKEHLPEYKIMRWDENNFDVESNVYTKEAYETKKYAFVTDFVRLYVMYNFGGIYMDTDVEVIQPLDKFLSHQAFSGFEAIDKVPTGIMASVKGHPTLKELLEYYDDRHFILPDSTLNLTTNVETITSYFKQRGLLLNNRMQTICDFTFYPKIVFCPHRSDLLTKDKKNVYTIHHFAGSWVPDKSLSGFAAIKNRTKENVKVLMRAILINILGRNRFERLRGRGDE